MNVLNIKWLFGVHNWKTLLFGGCTAITTEVFGLLGGWDMWLRALVLFIVLDYISGLLAAGIEKRLNSEVGFRGITKKVFIFILVVIAYQIDLLLGLTIIRLAVIGFYIGIEGLSVLENAGKVGVPIPNVLKESLEQLQTREDADYHRNHRY